MPNRRSSPDEILDSSLDYVFREVADVASWIPGMVVVDAGAGPQGDLVSLATTSESSASATGRVQNASGATFPTTRLEHPYKATIVHLAHNGELSNLIDLSEVFVAHPYVQPLPGDRYLVVGSRTYRFKDGSHERNGYVYGRDGRIERDFLMGDGIADVQCDATGSAWTSYFDEGIFGNFGWREPVGASGLLRFDAQGQIAWQFQAPAGFDSMADCYALNVVSHAEAYVYYYSDFAVMRISGDKPTEAWRTPIRGSGAIASFANHVALLGSYEDRDGLFVGHLESGGLTNITRHRYVFEGEDSPLGIGRLQGRGPRLTKMIGTRWFRCDIRELLAA
jgi:hypothetical protein